MKSKNRRNPEIERYFQSTEFFLNMILNEKYHEVRNFDDFLENIENILNKNKNELYFYTGWNYKPIKEHIDGKIKNTEYVNKKIMKI